MAFRRAGPGLRALSTSAAAITKASSLPVGDRGLRMPVIGLGTAVFTDIGPNQRNLSDQHADEIVRWGLDAGFRLIDAAHMYYNQRAIGDALGSVFAEGKLSRDELFLSTKVAHPNLEGSHETCPYVHDPQLSAYEGAAADIDSALRDFQVEQLDLMLVHWPGVFFSTDEELGRQKRSEIWRALEDAYESGKVRAIGVSNFELRHWEQLRESWRVQPMVNQIECHPYLPQVELIDAMHSQGTQVMCYCPLGSGQLGLLEDEGLHEIASKHRKTPGQVVLRWHMQRGCVPVPKSTNKERLRSNIDVFDFELDAREMAQLSKMETGARVCPSPADIA